MSDDSQDEDDKQVAKSAIDMKNILGYLNQGEWT